MCGGPIGRSEVLFSVLAKESHRDLRQILNSSAKMPAITRSYKEIRYLGK